MVAALIAQVTSGFILVPTGRVVDEAPVAVHVPAIEVSGRATIAPAPISIRAAIIPSGRHYDQPNLIGFEVRYLEAKTLQFYHVGCPSFIGAKLTAT
jgi:hypothetical protein